MNEKRPIITSTDYGKDEDSVQSLIKKLEAVERELSAFQHTVGRLSNLSQSLVDRSHFDRKNILQMQVMVFHPSINVFRNCRSSSVTFACRKK